jgi:hypothetical protein
MTALRLNRLRGGESVWGGDGVFVGASVDLEPKACRNIPLYTIRDIHCQQLADTRSYLELSAELPLTDSAWNVNKIRYLTMDTSLGAYPRSPAMALPHL